MRRFSALPDPFKPGRRASETLKYVRQGPISDLGTALPHLDALLTSTSTQGNLIIEKEEEGLAEPRAASRRARPRAR